MENDKNINFNPAQLVGIMAQQKVKMFVFGRGTGKSTLLAWFMAMAVKHMPRATFILVGNTYAQILSNTLKATKAGLDMLGFYEGVDYVVGTRAGKKMGFKLPHETPDRWENMIHWSNGTIFQLVSLDNANSGRGINSSGFISDETALQDEDKLAISVKNTNRAIPKEIIWKDNPYLFSETYATSMPVTKKGNWVLKYEEMCKQDPAKTLFLKADARCNMENLRPDYFDYMKQSYSSDLLYNAEMLNIQPKEVVGGFYPQLNPDIHYYTDHDNDYLEGLHNVGNLTQLDGRYFNCKQDRDFNPSMPLLISVDYNASINSLTVSQLQGDVYKVLNCFFVKSPAILDDLFTEKFIPYYDSYPTKIIKFYGDRNGNNRVANSKLTFSEQAATLLRNAGWKVHMMDVGKNPDHIDKFRLINVMLKRDGRGQLPAIRINEGNCKDLIISMEHAEAIDGPKGIQKDKRSERRELVEQEHATHFSDTFDYPLFSLFWEKFILGGKSTEDLPNSNIGS
ncbi:hypothetical protein LCGC14_1481700 [marine sediment metagenome]|uniref:Terminase-like family protein n=2 Tax=root TaxID=1 RepID=A0A831QN31_9FLAO|nr:hypothetical protein [Pricia sp.]HEA19958.1 hypothetical protein [Pricia antarctica]